MYDCFYLGCQALHLDLLDAPLVSSLIPFQLPGGSSNMLQPPIASIRARDVVPLLVHLAWFCRHRNHLLLRLLPSVLSILGNASQEPAMRDLPALFNPADVLQHFLRLWPDSDAAPHGPTSSPS